MANSKNSAQMFESAMSETARSISTAKDGLIDVAGILQKSFSKSSKDLDSIGKKAEDIREVLEDIGDISTVELGKSRKTLDMLNKRLKSEQDYLKAKRNEEIITKRIELLEKLRNDKALTLNKQEELLNELKKLGLDLDIKALAVTQNSTEEYEDRQRLLETITKVQQQQLVVTTKTATKLQEMNRTAGTLKGAMGQVKENMRKFASEIPSRAMDALKSKLVQIATWSKLIHDEFDAERTFRDINFGMSRFSGTLDQSFATVMKFRSTLVDVKKDARDMGYDGEVAANVMSDLSRKLFYLKTNSKGIKVLDIDNLKKDTDSILVYAKRAGVDVGTAIDTYQKGVLKFGKSAEESMRDFSSMTNTAAMFNSMLGNAGIHASTLAEHLADVQSNTRYWAQDMQTLNTMFNTHLYLLTKQGKTMEQSVSMAKAFDDSVRNPPPLVKWTAGTKMLKDLKKEMADVAKTAKEANKSLSKDALEKAVSEAEKKVVYKKFGLNDADADFALSYDKSATHTEDEERRYQQLRSKKAAADAQYDELKNSHNTGFTQANNLQTRLSSVNAGLSGTMEAWKKYIDMDSTVLHEGLGLGKDATEAEDLKQMFRKLTSLNLDKSASYQDAALAMAQADGFDLSGVIKDGKLQLDALGNLDWSKIDTSKMSDDDKKKYKQGLEQYKKYESMLQSANGGGAKSELEIAAENKGNVEKILNWLQNQGDKPLVQIAAALGGSALSLGSTLFSGVSLYEMIKLRKQLAGAPDVGGKGKSAPDVGGKTTVANKADDVVRTVANNADELASEAAKKNETIAKAAKSLTKGGGGRFGTIKKIVGATVLGTVVIGGIVYTVKQNDDGSIDYEPVDNSGSTELSAPPAATPSSEPRSGGTGVIDRAMSAGSAAVEAVVNDSALVEDVHYIRVSMDSLLSEEQRKKTNGMAVMGFSQSESLAKVKNPEIKNGDQIAMETASGLNWDGSTALSAGITAGFAALDVADGVAAAKGLTAMQAGSAVSGAAKAIPIAGGVITAGLGGYETFQLAQAGDTKGAVKKGIGTAIDAGIYGSAGTNPVSAALAGANGIMSGVTGAMEWVGDSTGLFDAKTMSLGTLVTDVGEIVTNLPDLFSYWGDALFGPSDEEKEAKRQYEHDLAVDKARARKEEKDEKAQYEQLDQFSKLLSNSEKILEIEKKWFQFDIESAVRDIMTDKGLSENAKKKLLKGMGTGAAGGEAVRFAMDATGNATASVKGLDNLFAAYSGEVD